MRSKRAGRVEFVVVGVCYLEFFLELKFYVDLIVYDIVGYKFILMFSVIGRIISGIKDYVCFLELVLFFRVI